MRYVFASNYVKGRVLDVACGSGYGSNYLARKEVKKVFGVDLDGTPLKIARKFYSLPNLELIQASVLELPFPDNFFDVVISFETIEHLYETDRYIFEIKRVLKKGGIFICSTPNIKYTQHPDFHVHEFYHNEFFALLENNFTEIEKYGQYISHMQRLNDILHPMARLFSLGAKTLNFIPNGETLKQKIKKLLGRPSSEKKDNGIVKPIKIEDTIIFMMGSNKIVPIGTKKGLLRMMIGVCKNDI